MRLFEAYQINEYGQRVQGSKNVAIKDYWLDSSREENLGGRRRDYEGQVSDRSRVGKLVRQRGFGQY